MAIVTLTTDFGTVDGYAGAMKGVILGIHPEAVIVDVTHEVPAQDVRAAAFALYRAVPFYPPEAVHCVVVDPGVGTVRRPLLLRTAEGRLLVGPDSGVFTLFLPPIARAEPEAWELTEPGWWGSPPTGRSATFHGRDIFAPVAANVARQLDAGEALDPAEFGRPARELARFEMPLPAEERRGWRGEVVVLDHFGNAVTNLPAWCAAGAGPGAAIQVGDHEIPFVRTYGDVAVGELCALVNSSGWIEIAERESSAAERLGLAPGIPVVMIREGA